MHFLIWIGIALAVWIWGDWRHWHQYYPTMLYAACLNLVYNLLCKNYLLWYYEPGPIFPTHTLTDLIYTFTMLPGIAILYLSHYPEHQKFRWIIYLMKWTICCFIVEAFYLYIGKIHYQHGWNLVWSLLIYILMFPMIRLHQKRPLLAIILSVPIVLVFLWLFQVPLVSTTEERGLP